MDRITQKLIQRKKYLQKILGKIDVKYKEMPEGTIYIARRESGIYYYLKQICNSSSRGYKTRYIKKSEKKLIHDLMQKGYIEKLRRAIEAEIGAISAYVKYMPEIVAEEVYEKLAEERKTIVSAEMISDEQFLRDWEAEQPKAGKLEIDTREFITDRGEAVRSKSEYMIANMLYKHRIPYKYENPVILHSGPVYPDFTIADVQNRREIYLEHLGMMDNPDYAEKTAWKLSEYSHEGITLGDRLLVTIETFSHPLDIRAAEITVLHALGKDAAQGENTAF